MEDFLIGIIKFFGQTIEDVIYALKGKKALFIVYTILITCVAIVYILTKYF